jgi:hypothetical protein
MLDLVSFIAKPFSFIYPTNLTAQLLLHPYFLNGVNLPQPQTKKGPEQRHVDN